MAPFERPPELSCPPEASTQRKSFQETLESGQDAVNQAVRDYLRHQWIPPNSPLPPEAESLLIRQVRERSDCEGRYQRDREGVIIERNDFRHDIEVAKTREYILGLPCIKNEKNSDVKEFFCGIVDGVGDDLHLLQYLLTNVGIFPEALASVRSPEGREEIAENNGGILPTDARSLWKLFAQIGIGGIMGKGIRWVAKATVRAGAQSIKENGDVFQSVSKRFWESVDGLSEGIQSRNPEMIETSLESLSEASKWLIKNSDSLPSSPYASDIQSALYKIHRDMKNINTRDMTVQSRRVIVSLSEEIDKLYRILWMRK